MAQSTSSIPYPFWGRQSVAGAGDRGKVLWSGAKRAPAIEFPCRQTGQGAGAFGAERGGEKKVLLSGKDFFIIRAPWTRVVCFADPKP